MYICICNKIPEYLLKALVEQGWELEDISETTGCSQNCGSCKQALEDLVESSKNNQKHTIPLDLL